MKHRIAVAYLACLIVMLAIRQDAIPLRIKRK